MFSGQIFITEILTPFLLEKIDHQQNLDHRFLMNSIPQGTGQGWVRHSVSRL